MTYARIENNAVVEYPVYAGDIQLRYPQTSFPFPFEPPSGYEPVADVTPPAVDYNQSLSEGTPTQLDGVWTRTWVVATASQAEIDARLAAKAQAIRADRDRRLRDSDWTQFGDVAVDSAAWATYRQALRDVPSQPGFPVDVTWPALPDLSVPAPNWRRFLADLRLTAAFASVRSQARVDVGLNAVATELRTVLGEAGMGMAEPAVIQGLLNELLPSLTALEIAEIDAAIIANNVPLTTTV